ncbi:MAG: isoprenylcysteine carboxylmethyltransferase family protein [Planctomycetes bacterium]|nr:isoprenylcysteine carboxylmethyltransferase family protein [Planctomycetota bacterium]
MKSNQVIPFGKEITLLGIDNIFELIFLAGFIAGSVIRKVYTFKCRHGKAVKKHKSVVDIILISAGGVGMVLPLFYLFSPWLNFADYHLPGWLGWIGTAVFAMALLLLWRSHADLGRNWSAILRIRQEHSLVTGGLYRHIRHPMYAAHLLWAIAQGLLLENWLAGWAFLIVFVPLYLVRVPKEERMMLEQFDEQYRQYVSRTGGIIMRFWK